MTSTRLIASLAALLLVSAACLAGCGACANDADHGTCADCDDNHAVCVKACTAETCKEACGEKREACYTAYCNQCG